MKLDKRRLGAVLVALLVLASGAAAYSAVFNAGSGTTYETGSGLVVTSGVDHGLETTNPFNDSETVYLDGVSFSSGGDGDLTVDQFRGDRTELSSIDATSSSITVDPNDKSAVTISGGVTALSWEDAAIDGSNQMTYSAGSSGTITATGLDPDRDWTAVTPGGNVIDSGTTSSSGEAQINVDSAENRELILFENDAPQIDNGSASPTGQVATNNPTLSINVSDSQFGTTQGESLDVEWRIDGEVVDTTTANSNGTASTSVSGLSGGIHNWSVSVSDDYGATTTSDTFQFEIPSSLTIRNVSAPNETISGASAELTFYYSDQTERRSDENGDGVINMTGLPVDEKFVVVVDADGYYRRHIIIDSIYEQSAIYLLPDNASTVESRFQIDDPTGEFQAGTTEVLVQRSVERDFDGDGDLESRYTTVAADEAGVAGFTTSLEEEARYRLVVRNQQGDTRVLGSYTATVSETVVLEPTPLGVELGNETAYNATARQVNTSTGDQLIFEFADGSGETTDLTLSIWEQGNVSNTPSGFENITFGGPLGTAKHVEPLEPSEADTTWIVRYEATRSGNEIAGEFVVGPNIQSPFSGGVPQWLQHATAIVTLILVAGLFSQLNSGVGAVTTAMVGGGFWWLGFLPPAAGGAVVIALFAAIIYKAGGDV